MIYFDRPSGRTIDQDDYTSGRTCAERGCDEPAGTPWGPYWCPEHDMERRERITRNLEAMIAALDARAAEEGGER